MNSYVRYRYIYTVVFVLMLALSASGKDSFNPAELSPASRTDIGADIAHYTYEITVDTGPYGKIRLHRFIRESQPYHPIPNLKGMLLLPGSNTTIMGNYATSLSSEHATWDHSILVYLAKNSIDVWGMDYAWALIPAGRKDFHFMKEWTIAKDARHAAAALSTVRMIRGYTGQGTDKLTLLGHSWGVTIGYALLSAETQKPAGEQNVKAFIPMENALKYSASYSAFRAEACTDADNIKAKLDSGIFVDDGGVVVVYLAWLAKTDPEGPSEIIPGFTNYQIFVYAFADPSLVQWRLFGGYFNKDGIPTGLRFTDPQFAIDLSLGFVPYYPLQAEWEELALKCDVDVAGFDHVDQIKVPILYVGAAGGFGESGYYSLTLTGSDDISYFTVRILPYKKRVFDFAHGDVIAANDAETLVWKPILNWILTH